MDTGTDLTLTLLSDVKKLLDVAVSRGAFKAEEMTAVGGVYDRYVAGLSALTKQQEPDTSEAEENPPEEAGSKE